jgi:subtilisin family serine protease
LSRILFANTLQQFLGLRKELAVAMIKKLTAVALSAVLSLPLIGSAGVAQSADLTFGELNRGKPGGGGGGTTQPTLYSWMSSEIADAWREGFQGQGTRITIVDDFSSGSRFLGNLGTGDQVLRHGEWVRLEAGMIAPSATLASHDFYSGRSVSLGKNQLNTLNLSYGMFAAAGITTVRWGSQESSIISYARNGSAVVVKAAGNDYGVAIGEANKDGRVDYLNRDLIGAQAAIFVGALDRNGTPTDLARMALYSNTAGSNPTVQSQFLSVGVRGDLTRLNGTSFAAPIVSGYAAVLGSKFTTATPTEITNQLLETARQDTIFNYNVNIHGRGEASISRALAPTSIR